ncbi:hypothetical protein VCRA2121O157_100071 [Vibrio crassostreae]|nr:hypothetical protein VCRA2113O140_100094 [Vibrio crassostreae]CAK1737016.1 hypothetical protein VCRA2113O137_120070 [Vibrio crassostreae]CAK2210964.1 hypothetical protein VCRA2116O141_100071 [Vibrio crassostreae]CAK2243747.1 hypothetical protein VCRA2113O138_90071 [Vibrio crassostreae]CAK2569790.1 hypothetical protein VCRA2113O139_100070 [Vibrio crassostreae]
MPTGVMSIVNWLSATARLIHRNITHPRSIHCRFVAVVECPPNLGCPVNSNKRSKIKRISDESKCLYRSSAVQPSAQSRQRLWTDAVPNHRPLGGNGSIHGNQIPWLTEAHTEWSEKEVTRLPAFTDLGKAPQSISVTEDINKAESVLGLSLTFDYGT